MNAVVDASILREPLDGDISIDRWITRLGDLAAIIGSEAIRGCCPRILIDEVLAAWSSDFAALREWLQTTGTPYSVPDLLIVLDQVAGRLHAAPIAASPDTVLLSDIVNSPRYSASLVSPAAREEFAEVLGLVAIARRNEGVPAFVATRPDSWEESSAQVEVHCDIELFVDSTGAEQTPEPGQAHAREVLPLHSESGETLAFLAGHLWMLVGAPEIATWAMWVARFGTEAALPELLVNDAFCSTLLRLQYDKRANAARTASCFRAVTSVLAGRPEDLAAIDAHPHRTSAGGDAQPIADDQGRVLYRGKIYTGPNAHRLFWWGGPCPEFLGVAGHDEKPPL